MLPSSSQPVPNFLEEQQLIRKLLQCYVILQNQKQGNVGVACQCLLVQAQRRRSPADAQALPKPLGPLPGSLTSPRQAKRCSGADAGAGTGDAATRQSQDAVVPQIQPTGAVLWVAFAGLQNQYVHHRAAKHQA